MLLEYSDFEKLQAMVSLPHDMFMRKQWLDGAVKNGYFEDICSNVKILDFALILHNDVLEYLNNEIVEKGTFYFYG